MTVVGSILRRYACCGVPLENQRRPGPNPKLCPACRARAAGLPPPPPPPRDGLTWKQRQARERAARLAPITREAELVRDLDALSYRLEYLGRRVEERFNRPLRAIDGRA